MERYNTYAQNFDIQQFASSHILSIRKNRGCTY